MTERVVFCRPYYHDPLAGKSRVEIGRMKEGTWAAVSDEALMSIGYRKPVPPLLYLSKEDYEYVTRKLEPPQVEQVIRKRLTDWSARALDETLNWVYQGERRCLVLAAIGGNAADAKAREALEEHFENGLQLLASLVGEGRYDEVKLSAMLIITLESEARMLGEYLFAREAAEKVGNTEDTRRMDRAVAAAKKRAETLGATIRALGRVEYGDALPYVELERVMFIQPRDAQFLAGLKSKNIPFFEWKDGVVAPWPTRKLAELQGEGKTTQVVYQNSGMFFEDTFELTRSQLERDVAERVTGDLATSGRSVSEHLNTLQLELNLLRRNAVRVAHREGSGLVGLLQDQAKDEARMLRTSLASNPSWLARMPKDPVESVGMLKDAEAQLAQDATFFEELCRRGRRPELRSRFGAIVKIKRRDAARIAALTGPAPRRA